jgi:hypothetical protein
VCLYALKNKKKEGRWKVYTWVSRSWIRENIPIKIHVFLLRTCFFLISMSYVNHEKKKNFVIWHITHARLPSLYFEYYHVVVILYIWHINKAKKKKEKLRKHARNHAFKIIFYLLLEKLTATDAV